MGDSPKKRSYDEVEDGKCSKKFNKCVNSKKIHFRSGIMNTTSSLVSIDIFDPIMDAFSNGDLEAMDNLTRNHCHSNVLFKVPSMNIESSGVNAAIAFWTLLHEIYPDAMIKTLDRRIGTLTTIPKSKKRAESAAMKQSVEYLYKFKATRITNRPIFETFKQILASTNLVKLSNHEEINRAVSRHIANFSPHNAEENECTFIVENVFIVDEDNHIINWSYDVLASNFR